MLSFWDVTCAQIDDTKTDILLYLRGGAEISALPIDLNGNTWQITILHSSKLIEFRLIHILFRDPSSTVVIRDHKLTFILF